MKPYCWRWLWISSWIHSCSIKVQITIFIIFHDSILWPWEEHFLPAVLFLLPRTANNSEVIKILHHLKPPCLLAQIELSLKQIWPQHFGWDGNFSVFPSCPHWHSQCFHWSHLRVAASQKCPQVSLIPVDVRKRHWLFTLTVVGLRNSPVSTFWWDGSCPTARENASLGKRSVEN